MDFDGDCCFCVTEYELLEFVVRGHAKSMSLAGGGKQSENLLFCDDK